MSRGPKTQPDQRAADGRAKVSVVCPTTSARHKWHGPRLYASFQAQDYEPRELVVVDSGSVAALVVVVAVLSRSQEAWFHRVVRLCSRMRRHLSGTRKSGAKITVILNSALV